MTGMTRVTGMTKMTKMTGIFWDYKHDWDD